MTSSISSLMFSWSCRGAAFLTGARIRPITSLARLPSLMIRSRASRTSSRSGGSAPSQRDAAGQCSGDRLADLMSDRCRQLARSCHAIGMGELHLRVTQVGLSLAQLFLGASQVLYVGARSVPFDDGSLFIAQRGKAQQKPAIFSVGPPQTHFLLERLSSREHRDPVVHGAFVGM